MVGAPSVVRISAKDAFVLSDRDGDSFRGSGVPVLRLRGLGKGGDTTGLANGGNGEPGGASVCAVGSVLVASAGL
jgi:hypothetical protein